MDDNPYESPRETGYCTPEDDAWKSWLRDRIALVITAVLFQIAFLGGSFLWAWLQDTR
jgi:hypothetical protein